MTAEQRRDLLEIMEDRHGRGSTMVTSQLPVEHWHEIIGDPTLADAILDRLDDRFHDSDHGTGGLLVDSSFADG